MAKYPTVQKGFAHLSQDDSLRNTTIQLVTGALLSAGLLLAGSGSAEAKPMPVPTLSAPASSGSAIILGHSSGMTNQENVVLAGHASHSSHASHASHASHFSAR